MRAADVVDVSRSSQVGMPDAKYARTDIFPIPCWRSDDCDYTSRFAATTTKRPSSRDATSHGTVFADHIADKYRYDWAHCKHYVSIPV